MDTLFLFVFLFEDLGTRSEWYLSSGWREMAEDIDRTRRDYGSQTNWSSYIRQSEIDLDEKATLIGKSAGDLRKTKWWPTPGQMKKQVKNADTAKVFEFLEEWFYRMFSSLSHLSLPGLRQTVRHSWRGLKPVRSFSNSPDSTLSPQPFC